jgi:hypothetical protein
MLLVTFAATVNPDTLSAHRRGKVYNIVGGQWVEGTGGAILEVLDPLTGEVLSSQKPSCT